MYICPLCNRLDDELNDVECPECSRKMQDEGKVMDYFDDYSAYQEIEDMKLVDGYPDDRKAHQCPHLFYCLACGKKETRLINEIIR